MERKKYKQKKESDMDLIIQAKIPNGIQMNT